MRGLGERRNRGLFRRSLRLLFSRFVLAEILFLRLQQFSCCLPYVVDRVHRGLAREIIVGRARRLLQHRLPLCDAIEQKLERLANIAVRLVVGVQIVLELIHQPRELLHAIVDHDARMLDDRMQHCVVDSVGAVLDELDVELYALIWLIGNGAYLFLLVRSKRILGALRMCDRDDQEKDSGEQECCARSCSKPAPWERSGQMTQRRNTCIISSFCTWFRFFNVDSSTGRSSSPAECNSSLRRNAVRSIRICAFLSRLLLLASAMWIFCV